MQLCIYEVERTCRFIVSLCIAMWWGSSMPLRYVLIILEANSLCDSKCTMCIPVVWHHFSGSGLSPNAYSYFSLLLAYAQDDMFDAYWYIFFLLEKWNKTHRWLHPHFILISNISCNMVVVSCFLEFLHVPTVKFCKSWL
jgi:hypothetical protein